jgi:hypothetical protein
MDDLAVLAATTYLTSCRLYLLWRSLQPPASSLQTGHSHLRDELHAGGCASCDEPLSVQVCVMAAEPLPADGSLGSARSKDGICPAANGMWREAAVAMRPGAPPAASDSSPRCSRSGIRRVRAQRWANRRCGNQVACIDCHSKALSGARFWSRSRRKWVIQPDCDTGVASIATTLDGHFSRAPRPSRTV